MSRRYGRLYEIRVNGESVLPMRTDRNLRVTFAVDVDFGGVNSYADLSVFNLSELGRARYPVGTRIEILAGYEGDYGSIFSGQIRNIFPGRSGAATETRVICRGVTARSTINRSFGKNTDIVTLLRAISDSLGVPLEVSVGDFTEDPKYSSGYTLSGDSLQYLTGLSYTHSFSFAFESERLVVVKNGKYRQGPAEQIDQFSGMEGIPVITEIGADVSVRLSPKYRIGGRFQITSALKSFNFSNVFFQDVPQSAGTGVYRIQRVQYSGDSHGDPWTVQLSGVRA